MRGGQIILGVLSWLLLFNSGCVNTRFLKNDEKLFVKNKIDFHSEGHKVKDKSTLSRELSELSQIQPNQKLLGLFKTRLWFYNISDKKKQNGKFREWVKTKVGEPPAIYDESFPSKSIVMMENYLRNKGFFYPKVTYESIFKRKKVKIIYHVEGGGRYYYEHIKFVTDSLLKISYLIESKSRESLLKSGEAFDVGELKSERERITDDVRNEGYYLFNQDMVYYDLDSTEKREAINVFIKTAAPFDSLDHRKFYINNVFIFSDFSFEQLSDTSLQLDTLQKGYYFFVSPKNINNNSIVKPYTILSAIYFKRGDLYRKSEVQKTIFNLTDLGVYKFINVKFEPIKSDSLDYLDAFIYLTIAKKQELGITFEANNNTYNLLGLNVTLGYLNKNLFEGAERFQFDISGGAETNFNNNPFFNTTDLNATASILFNKFLIPFRVKGLAKNVRPKTRLTTKVSFLTRVNNFVIISFNSSYGYEWRKKQGKHVFNIANFSLVRAPDARQSDDFRELLLQSPSLRNSFSEQLIVGMSHTYTWIYQPGKNNPHQLFLRFNNESSGNFLDGISAIVNFGNSKDRPRTAISINYAQYFKSEAEARHYFDFRRGSGRVASRAFIGIGVPYLNSKILPYVKQYFSGGSVSLRAWTVRSLGPGSFNFRKSPEFLKSGYVDQTGDIKLELNSEYRFDVMKFLKGALFVDAGNVWLARKDSQRIGADFKLNRFYKEIALGTGIGMRADFTYFIFRFDVGVQVFDPTIDDGTKWVIRNINVQEDRWLRNFFKFNIAIGYPF